MNDRLELAQEDEKRKKKVRCFLYIYRYIYESVVLLKGSQQVHVHVQTPHMYRIN